MLLLLSRDMWCFLAYQVDREQRTRAIPPAEMETQAQQAVLVHAKKEEQC
jgi:hypothetical protein